MTDDTEQSGLDLAGASAPAVVETTIVRTTPQALGYLLTPEQEEIAQRIDGYVGLLRQYMFALAADMWKLRESLERAVGKNNGWYNICSSRWGWDGKDANRLIDGWLALGGAAPPDMPSEGGENFPTLTGMEITPGAVLEIGKAPKAIRAALGREIVEGKLRPNRVTDIRARAKVLNTDAHRVALKAAPPPKPPEVSQGLPKMKPGTKASFGPAKELSKAKYGYLPEQKKERHYLIGSAAANERMIEDLKALRAKHGSSGAGKMTRISALAQALHAEFKSLGERYHGAWDKARDYPSYMTLWQHIWSEEEGYELHKELEAVNNDLSDMMRHFWIAGRHLYTEDFEVLP